MCHGQHGNLAREGSEVSDAVGAGQIKQKDQDVAQGEVDIHSALQTLSQAVPRLI